MTYEITVTYRDGTEDKLIANSKGEAKAVCREEVKWESTARVVCPAIDFDETGSFV